MCMILVAHKLLHVFSNNNIEGEAKEAKDHTPIENVVFLKCI